MRKLSIALVVLILLGLIGLGSWIVWNSDDAPERRTTTTASTIPLVSVPSEIGKREAVGVQHLEAAGLKATVVSGPSVNVSKGSVISQRPLPGTMVPHGTVVELTVSSGPR